jgi:GDPmannose 4,6-dehydratase
MCYNHNMKKKVLITGITGQDGSYLARFLLKKGNYEVHGVKRRSSSFNTARIDDLINNSSVYENDLFLHFGDMTDSISLNRIVNDVKPDEIYNLAAQSHVHVSFETPEYTANSDAMGALRLLEAIRQSGIEKTTKFYQASTSEMFGNAAHPQSELTSFMPNSPYATSKLFAYWITRNYRDAYGIFASNGILFNHESPLRGETFVTRKIVRGLVALSQGEKKTIYLGNLNAKRDWGDAEEFVELMWKMMQLKYPTDLVISTGRSVSVREFINMVAEALEIKLKWAGTGLEESAFLLDGTPAVKISRAYFRPLEVNCLVGDSSLARQLLDWKPQKTLEELIEKMVTYEMSDSIHLKR